MTTDRGLDPWSVALVTRFLDQTRGGLGRYEHALFLALQGLVDVHPVPIEALQVPDLVARAARVVGRDLRSVARGMPLVVRMTAPTDVVHLTNQMMAANLLLQRHKGGTAVTVHDVISLVRHPTWQTGRKTWIELAQDRLMVAGLRKADRLIAVSAATRDDLIRYTRIQHERICVVHQGVDVRLFRDPQPDDYLLREGYELGGSTRYVVYAGSLHPRKDVATLIRAFRLVRREVDATLVVAGSARIDATSPAVATVQRELDELRREGAARLTGHVSDRTLAAIYRGAAAAALPSHYEGFGLPVLEAMAAGCPTVSAAASSLPEVVGDAGLLFTPGDESDLAEKLVRILTDPGLAQRLRDSGTARAARFTWERTARETAAVYGEIAAQSIRRRRRSAVTT